MRQRVVESDPDATGVAVFGTEPRKRFFVKRLATAEDDGLRAGAKESAQDRDEKLKPLLLDEA